MSWSLPLPTTWKLCAAPTAANTCATSLFGSRLALLPLDPVDAVDADPEVGGPSVFLPDEQAARARAATVSVTTGVNHVRTIVDEPPRSRCQNGRTLADRGICVTVAPGPAWLALGRG